LSNTLNTNKVCAVIPFFNEAIHIQKIIDECSVYVDHIFAVNDGSTDGSEKKVIFNDKVTLISYYPNKGKGYALNEGFKKSVKEKYNVTVTIDADLQHSPKYIPLLVKELKNFDFVIGNRLTDFNTMPFPRIISNRLTSFLLSLKTKQKILDSQSGFRAYRTEIFNSVLPKFNGFEAESEIIILAIRKNFRIGFAVIPTIYGNEKSKMKSLKTIFGFLKILFI